MPLTVRTVATAAALLAGSLLAVAPPAQAAVAVQCNGSPVVLEESTETYVLSGECTTVTVTGSNVNATMPAAAKLVVKGSNVKVTSGRLGKVTVKASNVRVKVEGKAGPARVVGSNNLVKAVKGKRIKIVGSNNEARYTRLASLKIKGANNLAVVKKGKTKVKVRGANNRVRVNRRA